MPKGPIDNIPALVQIMAWRRPGDKPLFEPIMVGLLTHICVTRPQWVNKIDPYKTTAKQKIRTMCIFLGVFFISIVCKCIQNLCSLSGKTSYRKILWSREAVKFGVRLFQSLWNLTDTSAAALPRCLSNFRALRSLYHPISRLRGFTSFGGKTSYRLVNRGPCN